jgi:hypothetical protein
MSYEDFLITNSRLTSRRILLLEKLPVAQLVKKLAAVYGRQILIAVMTTPAPCPTLCPMNTVYIPIPNSSQIFLICNYLAQVIPSFRFSVQKSSRI